MWLAAAWLAALPAASAQTAGQYSATQPDLRGRWAGFLLGATDQMNKPAAGAVESFRFEAEVVAAAGGGYQMTLTRAPYDPGVSRQPITATFPITYDATGWMTFTTQIPAADGKLVTLQFRGQTTPKYKGPLMAGRAFSGTFEGPSKRYANRMIAGRITDAPGIAPIVPGLSAADLARWPVTLAQHNIENSGCYSSDTGPPALVHVDGDVAVYAPRASDLSEVCILHDGPRNKALYTASNPYLSDMSNADTAAVIKVLTAGWNKAWKAGMPRYISVYHFVKNEHLISVYGSPNEDPFYYTRDGAPSILVRADDLRAVGGVMLSPVQILAARTMELNKANQLAAKAIADAPNDALAVAEAEAARKSRKQIARATRASLAKKYGFVFHDDAYWAGVDYDPRNGEEPGADLREIFEGRNWAEQGSQLASAYLTRYVQVTGNTCGKALNWPKITIRVKRIDKTLNGFGMTIMDHSSDRYTTFYVDPFLYDEFSKAVDPKSNDGFTIAEGLKVTMDFLKGETVPLQVAAEQHMRALKSISWLVEKEGCMSPTTRQLAMNLKRMAQGKKSLQAEAVGAYGSRTGSSFYTENGYSFFGGMRIAKETLALKPIVAGGKTYTYQDLLRINADKIARNKKASRAWWWPVIVRDDAGDVYVIMNNTDPESEGDEVLRAYVVKVTRGDIDAWRAILARYDATKRLDAVRAERELMDLKLVRLLTYEAGGARVTADQDYPDFFERARKPVDGKLRPQTVADWVQDSLH